MTELREKLARTIAFDGRGRHDVSRDADHFWENSVPDQRVTAFRQADAIMALIDRPAPVVDREAVQRVATEAFRAGNNTGPDADQRVQDFVDVILSAVNAVSEAQVRADERDWLAALFESGALTEENSIQHDVPGVIRAQDDAARIAFRRTQEGGK